MTELETIKIEKESLANTIKLREAYLELLKDKNYQLVIEQAFMVDDCARYARLSGLSSNSEEVRADALSKAQAAGHLAEYLHMLNMKGMAAVNSLESLIQHEAELVLGE